MQSVTCDISIVQPLCLLPFPGTDFTFSSSPGLSHLQPLTWHLCFFPGADGNRYHLRCYMYQARDLPAMDKDSFSGRWGKEGEPGTRAKSWELSPGDFGPWGTGPELLLQVGVVLAGFVELAVVARSLWLPSCQVAGLTLCRVWLY